jgi:hypothetical protein
LQRFRRAFPWRTAALLAVLLGVPVLAFAAWFVWEIEPLQSYYLPAYRQCSKTAKQTGSTTEIRWLMKAAPGRASQPAIASDVTTEWIGNLSIRLSSSAFDNGWRGLERSAHEWGHSAELEDFLRSYIYGGVPYSNLIAFPLLEGSTMALMIAAFIAFTMRAELWQEWQRLWRQVMAGNSVTDNWWVSPPIRHGICQRIVIGKWLGKARSKLANWTARSHREPTIDTATIPVLLPRESPQGSVNVQAAEPSTKLSSEPPSQAALKDPAQSQSIFPGARNGNAARKRPVDWDESQWID